VDAFYDGGSGHDTLLIDYWGDYIQISTDFSPWGGNQHRSRCQWHDELKMN
jgi:hypothetical protein